jgi:hypothetical protein
MKKKKIHSFEYLADIIKFTMSLTPKQRKTTQTRWIPKGWENKETKLSEAVKTLAKALKEDKDYRYSWQANIAVCMQDAYDYANPEDKKDIHKISNDGANRFLDLLCKN